MREKTSKEADISRKTSSDMDGRIISVREYGTVGVNLRRYMDARSLTRYALSRKLQTRYEVIDKWYRGKMERIDTDVLARLCHFLSCEPGDLIVYSRPDEAAVCGADDAVMYRPDAADGCGPEAF